jgi:hypothetical protein
MGLSGAGTGTPIPNQQSLWVNFNSPLLFESYLPVSIIRFLVDWFVSDFMMLRTER